MDVGIDNFRHEKVQRFEEFVDRRLKPDLVHAIAERYAFVLVSQLRAF